MAERPGNGLDEGPVPICVSNPGCPAMVGRVVGQFSSCGSEPAHVGYVGRPRVRVFLCARHAGLPQLRDVAPMTDVDQAELDGRIVQYERALAGLRYDRVGPVDEDLERSL